MTTTKPKHRSMTELAAALKTAQAEYDQYANVTSRQLWRQAFQKDQEAAEQRGQLFSINSTGPALEEFKRVESITEASMRTKIQTLRWVLGKEEPRRRS